MITSLHSCLPSILDSIFKTALLLPIEKSFQEMFRQIDETFRVGTAECEWTATLTHSTLMVAILCSPMHRIYIHKPHWWVVLDSLSLSIYLSHIPHTHTHRTHTSCYTIHYTCEYDCHYCGVADVKQLQQQQQHSVLASMLQQVVTSVHGMQSTLSSPNSPLAAHMQTMLQQELASSSQQ